MKINKRSLALLLSLMFLLLSTLLFSLRSVGRRPQLNTLSTSVASPGETITIYGDFFGSDVSKGRVYIGKKMVFKEFIKSWSNKEIVITLADDFTSGMVVVDTMFGKSTPYLITSDIDVPVINEIDNNLNKPTIGEAEYSQSSGLKISIKGHSFGTFDNSSNLTLLDVNEKKVILENNSIVSWSDDLIVFYLPYGVRSLLISVKNSYGASDNFILERRGTIPITYSYENITSYRLEQRVDVKNVITLGLGVISLYLPTVYEDQSQKMVSFSTVRGKIIPELNIFKYDLKFDETGYSDNISLETTVDVGSLVTSIRSDLIDRVYDIESPGYQSGFKDNPDIYNSNKPIRDTGLWLVRDTSNRYKQVEIITNWLVRYIKISPDSSDDGSIAFENRSASEFGLVNIAVSMLRSVGIPCRVISGIKIGETTNNYRWLEFYLPNGGWVPYDLINYLNDRKYTIGTINNDLIGFTKGVKRIDYEYNKFQKGFYAIQNNLSNSNGNIESYEAVWHNVEIK